MGAWGHKAFDNDTANDWAYGLGDVTDLSLVESAFGAVEKIGDDYLDQDVACSALAACEVIARCQGNAGYTSAYTAKVDAWVAEHSPRPTSVLIDRARACIDRILGERSELGELWDATGDGAWRESVEELRRRLRRPE